MGDNIFLYSSYVDLTGASSTDEDDNENEKQPANKRQRRKNFSNAGPYWSKHPEDEARYTDWKLIVNYKHFARGDGDDDDDEEPNNNKGDDNDHYEAIYSVHRNMLGTKCDYFRTMFESNFSESTSGCTKLDLPDSVVTLQDFENLLDWLYMVTVELDPTNVVGMLYFSDYFCIDTLKVETQDYTRNHLHLMSSHYDSEFDTKSLAIYYRNAKIMNNEDLQNGVAHVCCLNPETMCVDSELITNLQDIDLWIAVFKAISYLDETHDMTTSKNVAVWSVHFADFCDQYPQQVDANNFKILTSKESLPKISEDAAVRLLEHEQRLGIANPSAVVQQVVPSVGQHHLLQDHHQNSTTRVMTCLQERCLDTLYDTETGLWNIRKPESVQGRLKNLSGFVLESIMMNSISNNSITQKDPTSIIVKGAEICNGIYRLSGYDTEIKAYIFHTHRTYLGESDRRIFRLSKHQCTEDKNVYYWFISVLPLLRGGRHNSAAAINSDEIDLYFASTSKRSNLPPYNGWCIPEDPAPGAVDENRVPILSYSKTETLREISALGI
jgi:hypothetical protein